MAQNDTPKAILTFWRAIFKFMEASWAKMYSPAAKRHALSDLAAGGGSAATLLSSKQRFACLSSAPVAVNGYRVTVCATPARGALARRGRGSAAAAFRAIRKPGTGRKNVPHLSFPPLSGVPFSGSIQHTCPGAGDRYSAHFFCHCRIPSRSIL